jgi:hypothetical protein
VSFLATIIVTYTVILVAYFWDCLPEVNLNDVDSIIIRRKYGDRKGKANVNEVDNFELVDIEKSKARVSTVEDSAIGKPTDIEETSKTNVNEVDGFITRPPKDIETRKAPLKRAIEVFILALSDQQLVTGLAILIAGFVKCDISIYLFSNVFAIAWFSCMTHLATLTVLRR